MCLCLRIPPHQRELQSVRQYPLPAPVTPEDHGAPALTRRSVSTGSRGSGARARRLRHEGHQGAPGVLQRPLQLLAQQLAGGGDDDGRQGDPTSQGGFGECCCCSPR
jgi:hypothetical protein